MAFMLMPFLSLDEEPSDGHTVYLNLNKIGINKESVKGYFSLAYLSSLSMYDSIKGHS